MDLEETQKIIQSKIADEAVTKNVRSKIKSYIHEKQNLREGFEETFKPLIIIESQDKVKESVDKEQNELIKQLQKNQLALTEGLDKNRLAITQGFDKMDEIKIGIYNNYQVLKQLKTLKKLKNLKKKKLKKFQKMEILNIEYHLKI